MPHGTRTPEQARHQEMVDVLEDILMEMKKKVPATTSTPDVKVQVAAPNVTVESPKTKAPSYSFDIQRKDGRISRIIAKPI